MNRSSSSQARQVSSEKIVSPRVAQDSDRFSFVQIDEPSITPPQQHNQTRLNSGGGSEMKQSELQESVLVSNQAIQNNPLNEFKFEEHEKVIPPRIKKVTIATNPTEEKKNQESLNGSQQDIIYNDSIYDKLTLSPLEKYQKYGRFPLKMVIHILLVLLTTSQVLFSSNTLSTNSTEQYQQWLQLFFNEPSNKNIQNKDFENTIQYYTTLDKLQSSLVKMFEEINTGNELRLQDVYFQESQTNLFVFYEYPMDESDYSTQTTNNDDPDPSGDDPTPDPDPDPDPVDDDTSLNNKQKGRNLREQDLNRMCEEIQTDRRLHNELTKRIPNWKQRYEQRMFQEVQQSSNFTSYANVQLVFPVDLQEGIMNPFNMTNKEEIKQILQITNEMKLKFQDVILIKSNLISCWNFTIEYDLVAKAVMQASLLAEGTTCDDGMFKKAIELHQKEFPPANSDDNGDGMQGEWVGRSTKRKSRRKDRSRKLQDTPKKTSNSIQGYIQDGDMYRNGNLLFTGFNTWIDLTTAAFSLTSMILCFKYLIQIIEVYIKALKQSTKSGLTTQMHSYELEKKQKRKAKKNFITLKRILAEQRPWQELSLSEKLSYFDNWFFLILFGNFFQGIGSLYLLMLDSHSQLDQDTQKINWIIGLGCFCSWVSLMKYMEYSAQLSVNLDVIKFALPRLFKLLIEFSPVFISFMIVGMTSFYLSDRFASARATLTTLISLIMADGIYDTIEDIEDNGQLPFYLADFYVVLFVVMFIISVTNIMIGILEDGYTRNQQEVQFRDYISRLSNEKQRMVISKQILEIQDKAIEPPRYSPTMNPSGMENSYGQLSPLQMPLRSQQGSTYSILNDQSPSMFPVIQPRRNDRLRSAQAVQQQYNSATLSPSPTFGSTKSNPQTSMMSAEQAAMAIKKVNRFVQLRKRKLSVQSNPSIPAEREQNRSSTSLFYDQPQRFESSSNLMEESGGSSNRNSTSLSQLPPAFKSSDQLQMEKDPSTNTFETLKKKRLESEQHNQMSYLVEDDDEDDEEGIDKNQSNNSTNRFVRNKSLNPSTIFLNELKSIKESSTKSTELEKSFKKGFKTMIKLLDDSSKLVSTLKFFNVNLNQKAEIHLKYSQYLIYFKQRVNSSLLELEHFDHE